MSLKKEVEEFIKDGKIPPCFWNGWINLVKVAPYQKQSTDLAQSP